MRDGPNDADAPAQTEQDWARYHAATAQFPPRPLLVRAVRLRSSPGVALDLGCGAGNDTRYLLAQGYAVTAVDASPTAIDAVRQLAHPRLNAVMATFIDVPLVADSFDLVSAQYALSFNPPATFHEVIARTIASLRPGGIFTGNIFGVRDAWNRAGSNMTFLARDEAESLFDSLDVLVFDEAETTVRLASGADHAGHVFDVIAMRPLAAETGP